jgi:hypothetical protein
VALTRARRRRLLTGLAAFLVSLLLLGLAADAAGAAGSSVAGVGGLLGTVSTTVADVAHQTLPAPAPQPAPAQQPAAQTPAPQQPSPTTTTPTAHAAAPDQAPTASAPPRSADAPKAAGTPAPSPSRRDPSVVGDVSGTIIKTVAPAAHDVRRAAATVVPATGRSSLVPPAVGGGGPALPPLAGPVVRALEAARNAVSGGGDSSGLPLKSQVTSVVEGVRLPQLPATLSFVETALPPLSPSRLLETLVPSGLVESLVTSGLVESLVTSGLVESLVPSGLVESLLPPRLVETLLPPVLVESVLHSPLENPSPVAGVVSEAGGGDGGQFGTAAGAAVTAGSGPPALIADGSTVATAEGRARGSASPHGDPAVGYATADPGAYPAAGENGAGVAISSSSSSVSAVPAVPHVPGQGGVPASAVGGVAACAGLALALLWLLVIVVPGACTRLRRRCQICFAAPFELILQRPG